MYLAWLAFRANPIAMTGLAVVILLGLIGVDYAVLWGVLAFLLNFIPNIGSIIAAIPAVLLALVQLGLAAALGIGLGTFLYWYLAFAPTMAHARLVAFFSSAAETSLSLENIKNAIPVTLRVIQPRVPEWTWPIRLSCGTSHRSIPLSMPMMIVMMNISSEALKVMRAALASPERAANVAI